MKEPNLEHLKGSSCMKRCKSRCVGILSLIKSKNECVHNDKHLHLHKPVYLYVGEEGNIIQLFTYNSTVDTIRPCVLKKIHSISFIVMNTLLSIKLDLFFILPAFYGTKQKFCMNGFHLGNWGIM